MKILTTVRTIIVMTIGDNQLEVCSHLLRDSKKNYIMRISNQILTFCIKGRNAKKQEKK